MSNQDNHQAARRFATGFSQSLSESLTAAAGHSWRLQTLDVSDASAQQGSSIYYRLTIEGLLCGDFFVEFHEPQVSELASAICGHALQTFSNEDGEGLRKVISTAMARFTSSLPSEYAAVSFQVQRVPSPGFSEMFVIPLTANREGRSSMPMKFYFNGKLLESLESGSGTKESAEAKRSQIDPVNLNLVLDVQLNMSLRFGQRQLPLREVLELASGSVVELDRQVDDPVELLLDGRVIARGEAVIVDGNYGLRVTEITEPIASNFIR
jgi:flagellar motor switch protein FliN/FliY